MKRNQTIPTLATLEKVELREQWPDEAQNFTPWLAEEDNLEILAKTIGLELELVNTEVSVGKYNLDILAKDINSGSSVIIENQLEKTDHDHLGKLITYASGLDAKIIIWISKSFNEEHRQAIDWLNEVSNENISFFALEIELWKIKNSPHAPKFNIVCHPNDWTKSLRSDSNNKELTETKILQREYWQNFKDYCESNDLVNFATQKASPQHWYLISIGRSGFQISLTANSQKNKLGCELYVSVPWSSYAVRQLMQEKELIEKEVGSKLVWKPSPKQVGHSRIIAYTDFNFKDQSTWNEQFKWLATNAVKFSKVFSKRIKALDPDVLRTFDEAS